MEAGENRKKPTVYNASKVLSVKRTKIHHIFPETEYTQTIRKRNQIV